MATRGSIRRAIVDVLESADRPLRLAEIERAVNELPTGPYAASSIRSSLGLQAHKEEGAVVRLSRGIYALRPMDSKVFKYGNATLVHGDAFTLMAAMPDESYHAVVTDPPYGLVEYDRNQVKKLRSGCGGVWRLPPSFDGAQRSPVPRFTTLSSKDRERILTFFEAFGEQCMRILVPGANVVVATNPLVCHLVGYALSKAGLEPRGQIIRLVQTMRGGDRPKGHEKEFDNVSVMPRSQYEPWVMMRKPLTGTVAKNLEDYGTGGWMRIDTNHPFGDVIKSAPTQAGERKIANHPSLKPQKLMRQIVRGCLPLGEGKILDPFCGSGSTLAAAEHLGYESVGIERDDTYYDLAKEAIPKLAALAS